MVELMCARMIGIRWRLFASEGMYMFIKVMGSIGLLKVLEFGCMG